MGLTKANQTSFKKGEHRSPSTEFKKGMKMSKEIIEKRTKAVIGKKHSHHLKGEKHKNWKGGRPKCIDCEKKLSSIYAKRCISCAGKLRRGEKNYLWKGGKPKCPMCGKKISYQSKGCSKCSAPKGEKNYRWIIDRSKLIKRQERNDSAYYDWRLNVWIRDNFKCKINNCDCSGKIIAHHILGWALYPELRYEINNGITLCQAHHPRKRAEEKRLIPNFQELVSVSK